MGQDREETGFAVKTYDVVKTAVLDFNKALEYMTNKLTQTTSDDDDLPSFVDRWWSNLPKVYRGLRLSLEAEGGHEISLFFLQTRVLDAIWNACFSLRDGPSPWKDMKIDVMKYRINGKGDCIVTGNAILRELEEDPGKAERILVSPRGSIDYDIKVAHREVRAGNDETANGDSETEAGPKPMASQAGQKRKHAHVGQKGKASETRRKRRASPDRERRNADVEDDSSDFNAKDSEGEAVVKLKREPAGNGADLQVAAAGTRSSEYESESESDSRAMADRRRTVSFMHRSKGNSGSGPGRKGAPAGAGKSTTPWQSTPRSDSQRTSTPKSWFDSMKPGAEAAGRSTKIPTGAGPSTKPVQPKPVAPKRTGTSSQPVPRKKP